MLIVVFPDGETWNALDGCSIQEIPDDLDIDEVEELLSNDGGLPVAEGLDLAIMVHNPDAIDIYGMETNRSHYRE
jgi:hypothetical protein